MTAVVQAICPGCKSRLRVPQAALDRPVRCGSCNTVLRLRLPDQVKAPQAIPLPQPRPASSHSAPPPRRREQIAVNQRRSLPPPPTRPRAERQGKEPLTRHPAPGSGPSKQPSSSALKGFLIALCVLVLAGTATAAGWSRIRPILFPVRANAVVEEKKDDSKPEDKKPAPPTSADKKPVAGQPPATKPGASTATPTYAKDIAPLVKTYCIRCHGSAKPKGGVVLDKDTSDETVKKNLKVWEKVADNLRSGEMPPAGAKKPSAAEMERISKWLDAVVLKVDCTKPQDPGRVTIRRLNRNEYNNTIRDLVGVKFEPAKDFPADDVGYGFDNIGDVLSLPPLLMEKYLAAAEKIINEAWKAPVLKKRLMPRQPGPRNRGALPANLKDFASKAWRRPATDAEVKRLMGFVTLAREQGDSFDVGIKMAFQAILISPHFLFRIEQDREGKGGVPVSEYELASRLSYFLWSSMPDDELTKLAREGKLRKPGIIEAQVKRMLKDPKARALAENFAGQWLNIRTLPGFSPDPKRFPGVNLQLKQAMVRETETFFLHVVQENRSILDFIDGDYTFVNERLAKHYGLKDVKGEYFRKVSLKDTPRGGVLTHGSVLAVTSNPTRTSPVKRGKWILDNILGTPPPPPPPDVDELKEDKELKGTLRQQMEQHRKNPTCASCHARMDPLGFGFENFDAVGSWRTLENKNKIDASGVLPDGSKFTGPAELRKILLKKKDQFARTLTEKLLTYALGRGMERPDRCFIEKIADSTAKADYKFQSLIIEIVKSEPFQKRRAKGGKK